MICLEYRMILMILSLEKFSFQAKKDRESKGKQQTGAKGTRDRVGPQQEKNIWITLVDHLSKQVNPEYFYETNVFFRTAAEYVKI